MFLTVISISANEINFSQLSIKSFQSYNCNFTPEGRILNMGTDGNPVWEWEYYLKDHLGNVRVVIEPTAEAGKSAVMQENHYYPFGMLMSQLSSSANSTNDYLFSGKQLERSFDLGWYDYGGRGNYNSQLGVWHSTDRFAEKYYNLTSYQYAANNPMLYIDINGDSLMLFKNGAYVGTYDNGVKEITGFNQESTVNENGEETFTGGQSFIFNDQEVDVQAVRNGAINKVEFVSDATVENQLQRSGVKDHQGIGYAKQESTASGQMDYGYQGLVKYKDLSKKSFYVRNGSAYNVADYGNYLWGRGMAELGITVGVASLGAHYNNFFNGRRGRDFFPQYDFGPGTYGKSGYFDSPGDQRAIIKGNMSHPKSPKDTWPTFNFRIK